MNNLVVHMDDIAVIEKCIKFFLEKQQFFIAFCKLCGRINRRRNVYAKKQKAS